MRIFISMFEIILCINLLFAISIFIPKKILVQKKPRYQLYLARLLFISCILSPMVVHFVDIPKSNVLTNIIRNEVTQQSAYHTIKNKIYEGIDETSIALSSHPEFDITYLYVFVSIIFALGGFFRIFKIYQDINKTKSIIKFAQPYKQCGSVRIKVSDQCVIPFSVRFFKAVYIILPVSILQSPINTKIAIAHEGQHHRQGDCVWAYVIELIRSIFWFNPFLITWHRLFQELQELACDEALIKNEIVSAYDYGACLFNLTKAASQHYYPHHQNLIVQMFSSHKHEKSLIIRRISMLSEYKSYSVSKSLLGMILISSGILVGSLTTAYAAKVLMVHDVSDSLNSIDTSSIDPKIQNIANNEIARVVNQSHAKSGAMVVADAHTGKIVAFAESGQPSENDSWKSRIFNPASTIKPFIAAAAFDAGIASESTIYDCQEPYQIDGKQFRNGSPKTGNLSVADAISNSVNICMIKVAQETGSIKIRQILSRFGFDMNAAWNKKHSDNLNLAYTALGSSIPVTLATLTKAYTILANKGHLTSDNSRNVISVRTANSVTHLLEKAVIEGTGKQAAIANIPVAGKTGTLSDDTHTLSLALFAGYVPANSPRYVSIVVIENAKINGSLAKANGGNVAAPVFRKVLEKILLI